MAKESSIVPDLTTNRGLQSMMLDIINFAVSTMLDVMDHTVFSYELSRNPPVVIELLGRGITDPRLKFMHIAHLALKEFKCRECGCVIFNYECPAVVCNQCTAEYIIVSKPSLTVCRMCPANDIKTCKQQKRLEIEYELERMEEMKDEYSYVIVDGGTTTLQKSAGNLEFYPDTHLEGEDGKLDRI